MHVSHELRCVHGNAARYCDVCEVEKLRASALVLFDRLERSQGWCRTWAACAIVLGALLALAVIVIKT